MKTEEIRNTVNKFMNVLDAKDWNGLRSVLSKNIDCDYPLRNSKEIISRDDFVLKRIEALDPLDTHHLLTNHQIILEDDTARCKASAVIWRRHNNREFNTHALYLFQMKKKEGRWRITAIKQEVLWNEGDPSIHSGTKNG